MLATHVVALLVKDGKVYTITTLASQESMHTLPGGYGYGGRNRLSLREAEEETNFESLCPTIKPSLAR